MPKHLSVDPDALNWPDACVQFRAGNTCENYWHRQYPVGMEKDTYNNIIRNPRPWN
jgi:hypothetical protein